MVWSEKAVQQWAAERVTKSERVLRVCKNDRVGLHTNTMSNEADCVQFCSRRPDGELGSWDARPPPEKKKQLLTVKKIYF